MNKDNKLMMEAMHGRPQQIIISELNKVHTILNQLSTLIELNRSEEIDQLLSKIRDVADMLIAEKPAEDAENAESSDERKERVQRGWDMNKKRWAKWKMENPEAAAKHAAKKAAKAAGKEENAAIAISLQKAGKKPS